MVSPKEAGPERKSLLMSILHVCTGLGLAPYTVTFSRGVLVQRAYARSFWPVTVYPSEDLQYPSVSALFNIF